MISGNKIKLTKNGEHVKTKLKVAEVLNNFFSNILKNLKIPQYSHFDPIAQNIKDLNFKTIVKYKIRSGFPTIQSKFKDKY